MPEISIVTPTFNRAALLPRLVDCVHEQTFTDWELIIVDDGSTDDTANVATAFAEKEPDRIRFDRLTRNQGSGAARNSGVAKARGRYIAFLDSDDTWKPEYLRRAVGLLKSEQKHWVVTAAERIDIDADGHETGRSVIRCDWKEQENYFGRRLGLYEALLTGNVVGETSRVVVARQALQVVGGFRTDLKLSQDYELWLRLARENYFLGVIDEPLVTYHKSPDSVTKTRFNEGLKYGYRIINQYCRDAVEADPLFARYYAEKMWRYARDAYRAGLPAGLFALCCIGNSYRFRWLYARKRNDHE